MAKAATLKDVLYALQFTGARLCMWPAMSRRPNAWSLEPGGIKVPPHVAHAAEQSGGIAPSQDPGLAAVAYVWRQ